MIITVRGLKNGLANAASVTALLAAMTAIVKSKKTLAIQITPYDAASILDYLEGKQLHAEEINAGFKVWKDEGIDALLVRSETSDLTKEHFDQTATAISDKENLFDVLKPTQKKEFFAFMKWDAIVNIIEGAKTVYDYIFILLAEMPELIEIAKEKADENIIVIPQGPKVEIDDDLTKTTLIVNDFEKDSIYTSKNIAKEYGVKKIYTLPHNYQYRDALLQKTLLDFVLKNKKDIKADVNFDFTSSVMSLLGKYVAGINDDEDEDIEKTMPKKKPKEEKMQADEIDPIEDQAIQEIIVKKGPFGIFKSKKLTADL